MIDPQRPANTHAIEPAEEAWLTHRRFALLLALFILAAFPEVILGMKTFYFRDFGIFSYPLAHYFRESIWRGEMPLWNPLNHCGLPFLAQWNTMVLYPGSLFYLLLPLSWALAFFCIAHLFLAGMGMFALALRWTKSRLAAALAGTAFAFNGLILNCMMGPGHVAAMGWMPWVFLTAERAWREGGRAWLLAVLVGTLQMLAGAPEIVLLTWGVAGLFALDQWRRERLASGRFILRFAAAIALISALSLAQILPFLDLVIHSQRTENFHGGLWSMPGTGWANFFVPIFHCFRAHQGVFFQYDQYFTSSYYLALGLIVLAVWAAARLRQGRVWLLSALAVLGLLLAMGANGPLYPLVERVFPAIRMIRFPVKFVLLTAPALILLGAFGLAALQQKTAAERQPETRRLFLIGLVFLVLIAGLLWYARHYPLPRNEWPATWRNGVGRAVFLILFLGTLSWLPRVERPRFRALLAVCLPVLLWLDVMTHSPKQNPTVEPWAFEPGTVNTNRGLTPHPHHGVCRAMMRAPDEEGLAHFRLQDGLQEYLGLRLGLYPNCNLLDDVSVVSGFYPLTLREAEEALALFNNTTNAELPRFADFLGVAHINVPGKYYEWQPRPTWLPMITAGQAPVFADFITILRTLKSSEFRPADKVYLPTETRSLVTVTNAAKAEIRDPRITTHRLDFTVTADQPAWVVVAQAFYHNWRAEVNGQPLPVFRANHAFQALQVPAGRSQVTLRYVDRAFQIGTVVSLASAVLWGVLWFRLRPAKSKQED